MSNRTGRVASDSAATISPPSEVHHVERDDALRTHSGHTIHCGHHSIIIADIKNVTTTSDLPSSLSCFSNVSMIERIPTHAAVAAP